MCEIESVKVKVWTWDCEIVKVGKWKYESESAWCDAMLDFCLRCFFLSKLINYKLEVDPMHDRKDWEATSERASYLVQLTIWYETIVVNIVDPDILKDYDSNWCLLHSEAQKYFVRHLFASYLHHLVWYEFMQVKGVIMSIEFIGTVRCSIPHASKKKHPIQSTN